MEETRVGAEIAMGSQGAIYEPEAAVAFVVTAAGVSSTTAEEVLRARDLAVVQMKSEGAGASREGAAQPTEAELVAWATEVLTAGTAVQESILRFVYADCGIRPAMALAVLAAEAEYMRTYGIVDADVARAFRDWAVRKQFALSQPSQF